MRRRTFLTITGVGALSGCLGQAGVKRADTADVPTPDYAPNDFYFGFEGYEVESDITITDEDEAPLNYEIQQRGETVDNDQSVVFDFAVTNESDQRVSSMSGWPAPFGFVSLADNDRRRSITPWADAYGDRISETRGPIPTGDVGIWTEIDPGETITEQYEIAHDTHGIQPGTYRLERDYPIRGPSEQHSKWTVQVALEVEISRADAGPESGDTLRDIVLRDQSGGSSFGGRLSIDVLEPITDRHPGLVEIAFVSEWNEVKVVKAEPGFPFESYAGESESGNPLIIMPARMYAPGHALKEGECWSAAFHPGADRRSRWTKTGFDPGERRSARYVVLAHPERNDECLVPVDYHFSQQYTLVSSDYGVEDEVVELAFTLTLREPDEQPETVTDLSFANPSW